MLHVLLIDDDPLMLEVLQTKVPWDKYSYTVMGAAANGEIALQMMKTTMPDLIVTDVKMPVMNGLDFCEAVRRLNDEIPIVLLSAYEDMETARLAMKYNVTEYILKPLSDGNLQLLCTVMEEQAHTRAQQAFYTGIRTPARRDEIVAHLAQMDLPWFCDFFIRFTDCFSARFQAVREACTIMIELLYSSRPDGRRQIAEQLKALADCFTKMDMVSFVTELYDHVLNVDDYAPVQVDYQDGIFQQICSYIDNHFAEPEFSAITLSDRFHFSADHISRLFSRRTGTTLNAYIGQKRMVTAEALLHNFDLPINEVAVRSGFRDQNYFARIFRRQMNVTPSEYRRKLQLEALTGPEHAQ